MLTLNDTLKNWEVVYEDETTASNCDIKYTEIDRARLAQFRIYKSGQPKLVIHLDPSRKLIYRRRVAKRIDGSEEIVYLAGWQQTIRGVNTQHICFLFEDGHIEVVDRFRENHKWFYGVVFLPEETTDAMPED